jgi:2-polyprenyl-3-methyl-5-hydroxy-6-metoxy-1,4-benzoquinol methylase
MRALAYKLYWKVEQKIAPGLKYSQYHYLDTIGPAMAPGVRWLDLGCGHQVFAEWMSSEETEVIARAALFVGVDVDVPGLQAHRNLKNPVLGSLTSLPFSDGAFELVTANMVVEHLDQPQIVLNEIRRILRPGGRFIFHTPNVRCFSIRIASWLPQFLKNILIRFLEGRREHDVFKTFYRMNTPEAVEELGQEADFRIDGVRLVTSSAATVMLGPIVLIELLALRILGHPYFARWRSNIIATLVKPR